MKAVLLAGGKGTRLWPSTKVINKHLIPIYDKPMIYYSLSTILLAGIREILIVCEPYSVDVFERLLGDGSQWGVKISYEVQNEAIGIPNAFALSEKFIDGEDVMLVLGDNILIGNYAGRFLKQFITLSGARIFTKAVEDPSQFGVVSYDDSGQIISIEEKPKNVKSNEAIVGIYFFDATAIEKISTLKKSDRGEYEITDLLKIYHREKNLDSTRLPLGTVWLDTGTVNGLVEASEYVRIVQNRQSTIIASPETIAWSNSWISNYEFESIIDAIPNCDYKNSLLNYMNQRGTTEMLL